MTRWLWPVQGRAPLFPDEPGRFAIERSTDVHTGIDLYCELNDTIVAVEAGTVIDVQKFTGRWCEGEDYSPWWNDTSVVLVKGASGIVAYGEIEPLVHPGMEIQAGFPVGVVSKSVLKKYKGRPMVMLHLELLSPDASEPAWWRLGEPRPSLLRDPEGYLREAAGSDLTYFDLKSYDGKAHRAPEVKDSGLVIPLFPNGDVLMLKRRSDDRNFTGWGFPGGAVERADKYEPKAAAVREMREETGLDVEVSDLYFRTQVTKMEGLTPVRVYDIFAYKASVPDDAEIALTDEHSGYARVSPREALTMDLAGPTTRILLQKLSEA